MGTQKTPISKSAKHSIKHNLWIKRLEVAKTRHQERTKPKKENAFGATDLILSLQTPTPKDAPHRKAPNPHSLTNRARLLAEESSQFMRVLNHPQFQQNPAKTIQQHLLNKMQLENQGKGM